MLYYVSGKVAVLEPGLAVIDCNGVGYGCRITAYTASQLKLNQNARLYITESIREDAYDIYGFISREEQRCYELLTSVNGVGPKAAIAILSAGGPQNFTLAVMTGDEKMLTMGLATMFVLICSNVVISSIKNLIPDMVRIPAFIVVIASFVTLLQMIMQAYVPALYATLGLFIPLIVVNCILLGRAEAFAAKNGPVPSFFDGLGMGLGFTLALTILGGVREFLGTGKLFDIAILPEQYGMLIFVLAPGAFIALGYLIAIVNKLKKA